MAEVINPAIVPALCLILSAGGLIGMGVASRRKKKKGGR